MTKSILTHKVLILLSSPEKYTNGEIAQHLHKGKSAISKAISKLKKDGLIYEIKVGWWKKYDLTDEGMKSVSNLLRGCVTPPPTSEGGAKYFFSHGERKDRCHNIRFKCKITRWPKDWKKMLKDGTIWREKPFTHWSAYTRREEGVTVQVTSRSVIFFVHPFYADNAEVATAKLFDVLNHWIKKLESEYEGLTLGKPDMIGTFISREDATQDDKYADKVRGLDLVVTTPFHTVDSSPKKPELDWTHKLLQQENFMTYSEFLDWGVNGGFERLTHLDKLDNLDKIAELHSFVTRLFYYTIEQKKDVKEAFNN